MNCLVFNVGVSTFELSVFYFDMIYLRGGKSYNNLVGNILIGFFIFVVNI